MRVDWAIPCRYAEANANLATVVGAGIDHMWVPDVPAPIQVIIAVRLVAMPDELGPDQSHTLFCRVLDSELNQLAELGGDFDTAAPEGVRPDWLVGIHIPMAVQFLAETAATYTIEVSVDDNSYRIPMHVIEGQPPGMAPPPAE